MKPKRYESQIIANQVRRSFRVERLKQNPERIRRDIAIIAPTVPIARRQRQLDAPARRFLNPQSAPGFCSRRLSYGFVEA
jgi:hypothetical protein